MTVRVWVRLGLELGLDVEVSTFGESDGGSSVGDCVDGVG